MIFFPDLCITMLCLQYVYSTLHCLHVVHFENHTHPDQLLQTTHSQYENLYTSD